MTDWNDSFLEGMNQIINHRVQAKKAELERQREAAFKQAVSEQMKRKEEEMKIKEEQELLALQKSMSGKLMATYIGSIALMFSILLLIAAAVYSTVVNPGIYISIGVLIPVEIFVSYKMIQYLMKGKFI